MNSRVGHGAAGDLEVEAGDMPRQLDEAQMQSALGMLSEAGLPIADLAQGSPARIFALGPIQALRGLVGLEVYGSFGLLRSLVVSPALRGGGLGKRLVEFVEQRAREQGVEELYLLTVSARGFFLKLGYVEVDRILAPKPVKATKEFLEICPQSSVLMKKRLVG